MNSSFKKISQTQEHVLKDPQEAQQGKNCSSQRLITVEVQDNGDKSVLTLEAGHR